MRLPTISVLVIDVSLEFDSLDHTMETLGKLMRSNPLTLWLLAVPSKNLGGAPPYFLKGESNKHLFKEKTDF